MDLIRSRQLFDLCDRLRIALTLIVAQAFLLIPPLVAAEAQQAGRPARIGIV